jgi:protein SCO1
VWDNLGMTAQSKFLSFVFICLITAAGFGAAYMWRHSEKTLELATGTLLTPSRKLPDFSLIDAQGRSFGAANLLGNWSLMFFGYTNCPDFCPTTLTTLAAMNKRLRAAHAAVLPQVIFVSVDAKRDTPAQLSKYVPYFDPAFIGLTAADQPSIEAFARQMGVGVIIEPAKDGNYTVDHSGFIFVFDPAGKLTAILTGPFSAETLQGDFQRILSARA